MRCRQSRNERSCYIRPRDDSRPSRGTDVMASSPGRHTGAVDQEHVLQPCASMRLRRLRVEPPANAGRAYAHHSVAGAGLRRAPARGRHAAVFVGDTTGSGAPAVRAMVGCARGYPVVGLTQAQAAHEPLRYTSARRRRWTAACARWHPVSSRSAGASSRSRDVYAQMIVAIVRPMRRRSTPAQHRRSTQHRNGHTATSVRRVYVGLWAAGGPISAKFFRAARAGCTSCRSRCANRPRASP